MSITTMQRLLCPRLALLLNLVLLQRGEKFSGAQKAEQQSVSSQHNQPRRK
jgi:hypothetical protein